MDNTFLKTEAGYDLIVKTFVAAAKTRERQKLKLFAKVLRGAYTEKASVHDPELYIKIIDELRERELAIMLLLHKVKNIENTNPPKYDGGMRKDADWFSSHYPEYTKEELEFTLPRLEKTGLIKEITGTYMGNTGGYYKPTELINHLVKYIDSNE